MPFAQRTILAATAYILGLATTSAVPSVEDFFRRPQVAGVSLSQDGRYLTYLTPSAKKYFELNSIDLEKGEPFKFDLKGDDVIYYYWRNAKELILGTQKMPLYWWREAIFDLATRQFTYNLTYVDLNYDVICEIKDRPGHFYTYIPSELHNPEIDIIDMKRKPKDIGGINNSRFNIVGGLTYPAGEFHGVLTDARGEIRAVLLYKDHQLRYQYRESASTAWHELPFDGEVTYVVSLTADPDLIYVVRGDVSNRVASLHSYRVSRNEYGPSLLDDPEYSMDDCHLLMTEDRKELLGLTYYQDRPVQILFSPILKEIQAKIDQALPGRSNRLIRVADKFSRLLVVSETDRNVSYLLYDRGTGQFSALPDPHPALRPEAMRPIRTIRFQARDGLGLEGFLTSPAVPDPKSPPPLIVMPHGGPWARDVWGFDPEVQFFVSRGFAVFQPNYRGSTGYNKAVSEVQKYEFRKMHDDVTDGVRFLIKSGAVDPDRIAIYGGSFGGYLAVSGVAFEPELYRCAITFAGVFDWKKLISQRKTNRSNDSYNFEVLMKNLDDPAQNRARFEEMSPIHHIDAIKAPVFVIHGWDDYTVDISQSKNLVAELDRNHVPNEFLYFADEGHGLSEDEKRVKCFTAIEAFLAKHMQPTAHGKN